MKKIKQTQLFILTFLITCFAFSFGCSNLFDENSGDSFVLPEDTEQFVMKAEEACPCLLPEEETDARYVLSDSDISALNEYKEALEEKGLDSNEKRLQQALLYQDLYQKSRSESDKTAEEYMMAALEKMQNSVQELSLEELNEMRSVLTANIDEINVIASNFKNELDPVFFEFTKAELKTLIQIRKLVLDEIAQRQ